MIKINLLRSIGLDTAAVPSAGGVVVSADTQKQAAFKILVMFLFTGLLYIYETLNISNLNQSLAALNTKIESVEQKKASFGDAAPKVEKYRKERDKIDAQLDVIRGIMKNRLREVKTLDSLQSLTPSQVWFNKVHVEGDLVRAEGFSNTEEGISTLYTALSNSQLFSNFEPKRQDEMNVNGIKVKHFEIEFHIGKRGAE